MLITVNTSNIAGTVGSHDAQSTNERARTLSSLQNSLVASCTLGEHSRNNVFWTSLTRRPSQSGIVVVFLPVNLPCPRFYSAVSFEHLPTQSNAKTKFLHNSFIRTRVISPMLCVHNLSGKPRSLGLRSIRVDQSHAPLFVAGLGYCRGSRHPCVMDSHHGIQRCTRWNERHICPFGNGTGRVGTGCGRLSVVSLNP